MSTFDKRKYTLSKKNVCCGCTACFSICPVKAISMKPDEEGFLYPHIDSEICIKCNLCDKVCAFNKIYCDSEMKSEELRVFAAKHKDEGIRMQSRSGGVFTSISDWIFAQNGVVYGCVMSSVNRAVHIRANNCRERDSMRGSKYIQSELEDTFQMIKQDLLDNKTVFFTGTSCQVAGLKSFLGKDYEKLFCMDIVCHGVPSPVVWRKYLQWIEKRHKGTCYAVDFRNKRDFGWAEHIETLYLKGDKGEKIVNSKVFKNLFCGHEILRPSCYVCPYKKLIHPGDITVGDFWGIQQILPEFDDDKGVSLVIINNLKGRFILNAIKEELELIEIGVRDEIMQPPLRMPFPKPIDREQFWREVNDEKFEKIAIKYGGYRTTLKKLKIKLKNLLKNFEGEAHSN